MDKKNILLLNSCFTWQSNVENTWSFFFFLLLIQEVILTSKVLIPGTSSFVNFYIVVKGQWVDFVNFRKTTALLAHETMVNLWKYFFLQPYLIFFMTRNKIFLRHLSHLTLMSHMLILGSVTWCSSMWSFRLSDEYIIILADLTGKRWHQIAEHLGSVRRNFPRRWKLWDWYKHMGQVTPLTLFNEGWFGNGSHIA